MNITSAKPRELSKSLEGLEASPAREPHSVVNTDHLGLIGGVVVLSGLLAAIYAANLRHFVYMWWTDDNYTHGFLVPLLSLYFAREAMRRGPISRQGGAVVGMVFLTVAILARLATIVVPVGIVGDVGFVIGVAGICAVMGGMGSLKRFAFPLAFLLFMIPLPVALYTALASPLQMLVSRMGSSALGLLGIPVLREGNMMTLPGGTKMFVAEACSGMRQLTGFLALTTAVAYMAAKPLWYRLILVASSIPIAMTANVLRVTLTGCIMHFLDPRYASGSFHTIEGLLMMGVGLGLLSLECAALNTILSPDTPEA